MDEDTENRRPLTDEEREEKRRLHEIWDKKRKIVGITQIDMGVRIGKSQGYVSALMNPNDKRKLSADYIVEFATALGVPIGDISPRLQRIVDLSQSVASTDGAQDAGELIEVYSGIHPDNRNEFLSVVKSVARAFSKANRQTES